MRRLQLYIGNDRVDLFKDETVSLTQTIQNVKDIAKVFTELHRRLPYQHLKRIIRYFSTIITLILILGLMQEIKQMQNLS